jgi:hypothetical protein
MPRNPRTDTRTHGLDDQDFRILLGDMAQVADQMRDQMRDMRQFTRNFSRLANAVSDTVALLRNGHTADALEVCVQAMSDVGATGYENDYDTPEWCSRFLGEEENCDDR